MTIVLRRFPLLAVLFVAAGCVERGREQAASSPASSLRSESPATSTACAARLVTDDAVGPLRLGVSIDSVRRMCRVVHDTTVKVYATAYPVRQLSVLLGDDTAVVSVASGRVRDIQLSSRTFATADSLGVGTTLRRILQLAQPKGYGVNGELVVASPAKCGLTFLFAGRFPELRDGEKDVAVLRRLPPDTPVDRIRIDGCPQEGGDAVLAEDDSTFDVQTDSVMVARDLDGNGVTDFVVSENRPYHRRVDMHWIRSSVYLDSIPARRTPAWTTGWNIGEGGLTVGQVEPLGPRGSLLVLVGNDGDYGSETLLALRDGRITEELTHGEDYDDGFFSARTEGGTVVVDASQKNLLLRGKPVPPELECPRGESAAVRLRWDEPSRRFVPDRPRCIKPPS